MTEVLPDDAALPSPAATLEKVAATARVSLKTASRALNGERHVAAATRARVVAAADALGFRPNLAASMLARGLDAHAVAFVTGDLANPFYSGVAKGMEQELRAHGAQLTVLSSDEDPDRERRLVVDLLRQPLRALALVSTADDHRWLADVPGRVPVVFIDRAAVRLDADAVLLDNEGGSRRATEHLLDAGHRRIALVGDLSRLATHRDRFAGYRSAMRAAGLDSERDVRRDAHTTLAAAQAVHDLMTQPDPPSALFTTNNRITVGALQSLDLLGADPALVGFDDFELADVLGVSVVAHDPVEMGRTAVRLAFSRSVNRALEPRRVLLPTRLVMRGSGERAPQKWPRSHTHGPGAPAPTPAGAA